MIGLESTVQMPSITNSKSLPKLIKDRFQLGDKVGSGSFGEIYVGCDIEDKKLVAIKIEPLNARSPQLIYEAKIYQYLGPGEGIPKLYWYGTEACYNIMIIDFLGPSLEDILNKHKTLPVKFILDLAQQMITRVEFLHEKMLLHRDIKPENFLVGSGTHSSMLHLIDFGLVKRYRDNNGKHIPYRESKGMTGTARYVSICTHLGIEQARRDDLEGIAYVLIYLMKGQLPWQGLKASLKAEKYGKILRKKLNTTVKDLCQDLPPCFNYLLSYCRVLRFQDRPDYSLLRQHFLNELKQSQSHTTLGLDTKHLQLSSLTILKSIPSDPLYHYTFPTIDQHKSQPKNRTKKRKLFGESPNELPTSTPPHFLSSISYNINSTNPHQIGFSYSSKFIKNLTFMPRQHPLRVLYPSRE